MGLVGLYLGISGFLKLRESLETTKASVEAYAILRSRGAARVVAAALPAVEIAIGALLVCCLAPLLAGTAAAILLLGYGAVMTSALVRGISTNCGCHGSLSHGEVRPMLVVRNLVLTAILVAASIVLTHNGSVATLALSMTAAAAAVLAGVTLTVMRFLRARMRGAVEEEENATIVQYQ